MIRSCLKTIAVVLIVIPEPVTTALGVALLSAAFASACYKQQDKFENMDELLKRSLRSTGQHKPGHYPGKIVHHTLRANPPLYRPLPAHNPAVRFKPARQVTVRTAGFCSASRI